MSRTHIQHPIRVSQSLPVYLLSQEAFKKNAPGFIAMGLHGGPVAAEALAMLEKSSTEPLRVGSFRELAGLVPPDLMRVLHRLHFGFLMVYGNAKWGRALAAMKQTGATLKGVMQLGKELREQRQLTWHLLHPENDLVHPSRSMPCQWHMGRGSP